MELDGLLKNGSFVATKLKDVPEGTLVFNPPFIDELRQVGDYLRRNRRLFAQNYEDE